MQNLKVKIMNPDAKLPTRAHSGDAGLDLYATQGITLPPQEPVKVPTGIAIALPEAHVGLICDRSSLGSKGVRTLGGVIDAGYRGEIQVLLMNLRREPLSLAKGDKVAQMLVLPITLCNVMEADAIDETSRSAQGFGSSGR